MRHPRTLGDLDYLSMQLLDDRRAERACDLQDRLRVWNLAGIDARKHPRHQIGPHFALQVVVAPVEQLLQHQHADRDVGRCPGPSAAATLRPVRFKRLGHHLNHSFVLEQRVDTFAACRATGLRTDWIYEARSGRPRSTGGHHRVAESEVERLVHAGRGTQRPGRRRRSPGSSSRSADATACAPSWRQCGSTA